ncbi:glycine zipper 2TM domain-containing protein [Hymenobacter sp. M29]|uniref:Glycine zipper 2TM domain-containing protein n=1 Tax=Hymenobacter mellowenesis TaxID=3063995 RepID=A0ABT9AA48_9BACT|nr:glycine zipper 2TM domain-containing protein [Hymenobacter sp. M29]MDO7845617.1 glycine zipper 2TM domain-containing protein [Hymenobacter sp. M29]
MKKLPYFLTLIILISTVFGSAPAKAQWSPQAKGAVIGGLGGAAAGALINKRNRAVGGVVGGVAGGAIGYGVGKHIDNKKKQRAAAQQRAVAAREAAYRRELALARNRQTTVTTSTQPTAVPVNSLTASTAAMPGAMAQPGVSNTYLANPHYGDASKPYSTEEVRRKSW